MQINADGDLSGIDRSAQKQTGDRDENSLVAVGQRTAGHRHVAFVTDQPQVLEQLHEKGIDKFIAYELPVDLVKERYGGHFAAEVHDLHQSNDLQIIDEDGDRAFALFHFREFGHRVRYERDEAASFPSINLRDAVIDALAFEPSVRSENIGIVVEDETVKLTGSVGTYSEKRKTEEVVRQVRGVGGLVQEIEVCPSGDDGVSDEEIAKRALSILAWDTRVPQDTIQVRVEDGRVILTGEVVWYYQKAAAENALHRLHGVKRIDNNIAIQPPQWLPDIKARIESALKRTATLEADRIRISVTGQTVLLEGQVNSWAARDAAENTAWATPGVADVDDRLQITGSG
ncbi:MAG TPA: BON domain-containing protein [Stellaceae bacterium]|nr:BON domain-containing protein [Stellaceae bacterium]